MKRTITLTGRTGRLDVPSFTLAENETLTVTFNIVNEIRVGRYIVVVRHGSALKKTFALSSDNSIDLSAEWLTAGGTEPGTLKLKDDYCIEPLIVTAQDGNWTATAELQKLETEITELKQTVSALSAGYETLRATVAGLPAMIEQSKKEAVIEAAGGDPMGA